MSNDGVMPTNAESVAVDTSVAIAALDATHAAHATCRSAVVTLRPALAGHAAFETLSVLTRMPGPLRVDAPTATRIITTVFPTVLWLGGAEATSLLQRLGPLGITGGAIYDALVAEAARAHDARLLTRDHRARRTYDLLGVHYEILV